MNVVIYARVSSQEQAKAGLSIPAQMKKIKEYAYGKDHNIIKEFMEIETAKKAGRKVFDEMVMFVKDHKEVEGIICHKVDRLCRNFKDYVTIDSLSITPLFVDEEFPDNAAGKLTFGLKVLLAKHYIDNLSDEVKKGQTEKAEQGNYPSYAPIGYLNNLKTKLIELDPVKAPLIKRLFEYYSTGRYSIRDIRAKSIEIGMTEKSGKPLSKSRTQQILRNPLYYGGFMWDGKLYEGSHEPIVTKKMFDQVQRIMENRSKKNIRKMNFAFSGMITCSKCGCLYTAELQKERYVYYRCARSRGKCESPYVREEKMSELLGETLKQIQITPEVAEWLRNALKESQSEKKDYHQKETARIQKHLERLKMRLDSAYEDRLEGLLSEELWKRKSKVWENEILALRFQLKDHDVANFSYYDKGSEILELAQMAHSLYLQQNAENQREILESVSLNFVFDGVSVIPTYRKPFDLLAKNTQIKNWLPK